MALNTVRNHLTNLNVRVDNVNIRLDRSDEFVRDMSQLLNLIITDPDLNNKLKEDVEFRELAEKLDKKCSEIVNDGNTAPNINNTGAAEPVPNINNTGAAEPVPNINNTCVAEPVPNINNTCVAEPVPNINNTCVAEPVNGYALIDLIKNVFKKYLTYEGLLTVIVSTVVLSMLKELISILWNVVCVSANCVGVAICAVACTNPIITTGIVIGTAMIILTSWLIYSSSSDSNK